MINNITFTFNRPMQLHLLLESIEKNAKNIFNLNIIYKYSDDNFKKGYELVKNNFPNCNWIEQKNFKEQTLNSLNSNLELTCFFVDDDIIYNHVDEQDIHNCMKNEDLICFSLRLGINVKKCYTMHCENVLIPLKESEKIVWWDWTKHYMDFNYPLSLDGHIFRTKEITKLVRKVNFQNPNLLEGGLQIFENFPKEQMAAYKHSVLVNSPNNIVNETHPNRKGELFYKSTKELNQKYLDGFIIDYKSIDFSSIIGCHQELNYEFIKK